MATANIKYKKELAIKWNNLADYFITVGAVMLVISVVFCKKNITPRKAKAEE